MDFTTAGKPGEMMAHIAVAGFDSEGQVFACIELCLRDQPVKAGPVIGQKRPAASRPATWCAKPAQAPTHSKQPSHHWLKKAFWCATAAADQPGMRCHEDRLRP